MIPVITPAPSGETGALQVTIVPDAVAENLGCMQSRPVGSWFRPDVEVTPRAHSLIEKQILITLAGMETQSKWCRNLPNCPQGWEEAVRHGADSDLGNVVDLACYVTGGPEEAGAYIEWLRQRCLNRMGGLFWAGITMLAVELLDRRTLSGRAVRAVLQRPPRSYRAQAQMSERGPAG